MKSTIMSNVKKNQKNLEKEELLQAVIVADDFAGMFADFTEQASSVLLPVANFPAIDYALECLGRSGFQETILFCSSHAQAIKDHLKKSPWNQPSSTMNVTVLVSEKCHSLGDALRDIDSRAVIKGFFALISAFTLTNLNLLDILKYHKQLCTKDKGTAMTMVLQDVGSRLPKLDNYNYVINAESNRLLMHLKSLELKKFEIPLERLVENVNMNIYSNLIDTGIAICSPSVPLLFSDNFDFQTKEDFIKGLLLYEEVLDSRIYCYQVKNGYGATIKNWQTFQRISMDCIQRWTFPLVPDQLFASEGPFLYLRNFVYKQPGVQLLNSVRLESDVIIGANSQFGHNTRILRCVIGKNCCIGQNVVVRDCYIFDNVVIGDNCKLELCIIGENSKVGENSSLSKCFLKRDVVLKLNSVLEEVLLMCESQGKNWKKLNDKAFFLKTKEGDMGSDEDLYETTFSELVDPETEYFENDEMDETSSFSDGDKSYTQSPEPDDNTLFYNEVVDSLHRGFEEELSCENLILEINSSRYAYNINLSDVTVLTLKGILLLQERVNASPKKLLTYFLPLLQNYIKTSEAQMDCLELIEEISGELGNEVAKCLHFLYDNDIMFEDNILKWYEQLEKDSPVLKKVAPLIKWLEEAAEESSSEEE